MKHIFPLLFFLCLNLIVAAQQPNAITGNRIKTPWAEKVSVTNPLPEYPRPQMVRKNNWISLNGQWDFTIQPKGQEYSRYSIHYILHHFASTFVNFLIDVHPAFCNGSGNSNTSITQVCDIYLNGKAAPILIE